MCQQNGELSSLSVVTPVTVTSFRHRNYAIDCSSRMWTYSRSAAGKESLVCNCSLSRKQQYYAVQTCGSFTMFTTPSKLHFTSCMLEFSHSLPCRCFSVSLDSLKLYCTKLYQIPSSSSIYEKTLRQTETGCVLHLNSNLCLYLEHIKLRCHHILFLNVFQSLLIMGH